MWCASDNHNNMRHIRAKELLDVQILVKQLFTKYQYLTKLPQISYRVYAYIRSLQKHPTLSFTVVECNQLKWVGEFYVLISTT